jgi:hypothetical protein
MEDEKQKIAEELTIMFKDEIDIPERFKKNSKTKTYKKDSLIEARFKNHIKIWIQTIDSILNNHVDQDQAWRFVKLRPEIDIQSLKKVTKNKDFLDFTDLLIKRRDIDNCDPNELGNLSILHTAFQKKIENLIS